MSQKDTFKLRANLLVLNALIFSKNAMSFKCHFYGLSYLFILDIYLLLANLSKWIKLAICHAVIVEFFKFHDDQMT